MQENYIWLDNASTTEPKFFGKDYSYYWFNPNSNHKAGLEARKELDKARERIKESLGLKNGKLIIGGSASHLIDNLMWYVK